MFAADDIEHIYHVVAPKLMVQFQMAMFREHEPFRLGKDTRIYRLDW
jgi:hypothetical protein